MGNFMNTPVLFGKLLTVPVKRSAQQSDPQHEFMADNYIDIIAQATYESFPPDFQFRNTLGGIIKQMPGQDFKGLPRGETFLGNELG